MPVAPNDPHKLPPPTPTVSKSEDEGEGEEAVDPTQTAASRVWTESGGPPSSTKKPTLTRGVRKLSGDKRERPSFREALAWLVEATKIRSFATSIFQYLNPTNLKSFRGTKKAGLADHDLKVIDTQDSPSVVDDIWNGTLATPHDLPPPPPEPFHEDDWNNPPYLTEDGAYSRLEDQPEGTWLIRAEAKTNEAEKYYLVIKDENGSITEKDISNIAGLEELDINSKQFLRVKKPPQKPKLPAASALDKLLEDTFNTVSDKPDKSDITAKLFEEVQAELEISDQEDQETELDDKLEYYVKTSADIENVATSVLGQSAAESKLEKEEASQTESAKKPVVTHPTRSWVKAAPDIQYALAHIFETREAIGSQQRQSISLDKVGEYIIQTHEEGFERNAEIAENFLNNHKNMGVSKEELAEKMADAYRNLEEQENMDGVLLKDVAKAKINKLYQEGKVSESLIQEFYKQIDEKPLITITPRVEKRADPQKGLEECLENFRKLKGDDRDKFAKDLAQDFRKMQLLAIKNTDLSKMTVKALDKGKGEEPLPINDYTDQIQKFTCLLIGTGGMTGEAPDPKEVKNIVKTLLTTIDYSLEIGDYNTAGNISVMLAIPAIERIIHEVAGASDEEIARIKELVTLFSESKNYKMLREHMNQSKAEGIIPYFPAISAQLKATHEQATRLGENREYNLAKLQGFAISQKPLALVQETKETKVTSITQFDLTKLPTDFEEKELYQMDRVQRALLGKHDNLSVKKAKAQAKELFLGKAYIKGRSLAQKYRDLTRAKREEIHANFNSYLNNAEEPDVFMKNFYDELKKHGVEKTFIKGQIQYEVANPPNTNRFLASPSPAAKIMQHIFKEEGRPYVKQHIRPALKDVKKKSPKLHEQRIKNTKQFQRKLDFIISKIKTPDIANEPQKQNVVDLMEGLHINLEELKKVELSHDDTLALYTQLEENVKTIYEELIDLLNNLAAENKTDEMHLVKDFIGILRIYCNELEMYKEATHIDENMMAHNLAANILAAVEGSALELPSGIQHALRVIYDEVENVAGEDTARRVVAQKLLQDLINPVILDADSPLLKAKGKKAKFKKLAKKIKKPRSKTQKNLEGVNRQIHNAVNRASTKVDKKPITGFINKEASEALELRVDNIAAHFAKETEAKLPGIVLESAMAVPLKIDEAAVEKAIEGLRQEVHETKSHTALTTTAKKRFGRLLKTRKGSKPYEGDIPTFNMGKNLAKEYVSNPHESLHLTLVGILAEIEEPETLIAGFCSALNDKELTQFLKDQIGYNISEALKSDYRPTADSTLKRDSPSYKIMQHLFKKVREKHVQDIPFEEIGADADHELIMEKFVNGYVSPAVVSSRDLPNPIKDAFSQVKEELKDWPNLGPETVQALFMSFLIDPKWANLSDDDPKKLIADWFKADYIDLYDFSAEEVSEPMVYDLEDEEKPVVSEFKTMTSKTEGEEATYALPTIEALPPLIHEDVEQPEKLVETQVASHFESAVGKLDEDKTKEEAVVEFFDWVNGLNEEEAIQAGKDFLKFLEENKGTKNEHEIYTLRAFALILKSKLKAIKEERKCSPPPSGEVKKFI